MLNKGVWVLNSMAPLGFGMAFCYCYFLAFPGMTGGRVIMALEVFCQIPSSWRGLEILFVTLNFYHVSFCTVNSLVCVGDKNFDVNISRSRNLGIPPHQIL